MSGIVAANGRAVTRLELAGERLLARCRRTLRRYSIAGARLGEIGARQRRRGARRSAPGRAPLAARADGRGAEARRQSRRTCIAGLPGLEHPRVPPAAELFRVGEARSVGVAPPSGIVWRGGVWLGDDELPLHGARTLHRCDAGSGALRPVAGYADGSAGFVG